MSVHVSRDELDYERFVAWIVLYGKVVAVGDGQDEQDAKDAALADLASLDYSTDIVRGK